MLCWPIYTPHRRTAHNAQHDDVALFGYQMWKFAMPTAIKRFYAILKSIRNHKHNHINALTHTQKRHRRAHNCFKLNLMIVVY